MLGQKAGYKMHRMTCTGNGKEGVVPAAVKSGGRCGGDGRCGGRVQAALAARTTVGSTPNTAAEATWSGGPTGPALADAV
jgi:hypothetical protein